MKGQTLLHNSVSVIKEKNPSQGIHWHSDFEIVSVLKGILSLHIGFEKLILNQGDTMIVNSLETHSLASLEQNTEVLFLSLNKESCLQINSHFYESIAIVDYSVGFAQLQEARVKITQSIGALLKSPQQMVHERMTDLLNLLSSVCKPRIPKAGLMVAASEEKIKMLYRMINYLYKNYNTSPSLDDFLKEEHYSLYYISHVIAEITGTSFRDWLTYIRVEQSEKALLATDAPISNIAYEVGFSSVRYYNANFKKWYGMTPVNYRLLYKHRYEESPQIPTDDLPTEKNLLHEYLENNMNYEKQIFAIVVHQNPVFKDQSLEELRISIDGISGDYKLTTYQYNKKHEPRVAFEKISFQGRGELRAKIPENSCQMLVLNPLSTS